MAKYPKKSKHIILYGFTGLLLALNMLILPQIADFGTMAEKTASAAIEVAEAKTAEPVAAKEEKAAPKRVIYVTVTAYSSTPDQTDDTPFITANGTRVRDGIIAANFLRFGAKVKFPNYSGDKIYEVTDRMNSRYPSRADIWMATREQALQFGIQTLKMEIY